MKVKESVQGIVRLNKDPLHRNQLEGWITLSCYGSMMSSIETISPAYRLDLVNGAAPLILRLLEGRGYAEFLNHGTIHFAMSVPERSINNHLLTKNIGNTSTNVQAACIHRFSRRSFAMLLILVPYLRKRSSISLSVCTSTATSTAT